MRRYRPENGNSGQPFVMVPCLHQSNVYFKRKIWVWRVQKCIPLVGAKSSLNCAGLQTTPCHVRQNRSENRNLWKSGSTFFHVSMFAPKQCLYQKEATHMESPKMYSSRRCKNLTCVGLQTTLSQVSQYRAENGNFRKIRVYH